MRQSLRCSRYRVYSAGGVHQQSAIITVVDKSRIVPLVYCCADTALLHGCGWQSRSRDDINMGHEKAYRLQPRRTFRREQRAVCTGERSGLM